MFKSPTYGPILFENIPKKMHTFIESTLKYNSDYKITIGTDSQNFSDTKIVSVIAIVCEGHGGAFFYEVTHVPKIQDVRTKLYTETQMSLDVAMRFIDVLEKSDTIECKTIYNKCPIAIHVDAGNSPEGKTSQLIPEIVGWVRACGYECAVKPDSYAASSIADKISK